jgi:hypothetical protein
MLMMMHTSATIFPMPRNMIPSLPINRGYSTSHARSLTSALRAGLPSSIHDYRITMSAQFGIDLLGRGRPALCTEHDKKPAA